MTQAVRVRRQNPTAQEGIAPAMGGVIRDPARSGSAQDIWPVLRCQAEEHARLEPLLARGLHACVLDHECFESAFGYVIGTSLGNETLGAAPLAALTTECVAAEPALAERMRRDLLAAYSRDPAGYDLVNVFLNQKGFLALQAYRLTHHLWGAGRYGLALHLQGRIAQTWGLDIHPAARIGAGVSIDHGTGVVIGETSIIADEVSIFQGVTLGGTGKERGDRHPKIERGALICAGAKILGNVRIGAYARIGAGAMVLDHVPAGATAVGIPATVVHVRELAHDNAR